MTGWIGQGSYYNYTKDHALTVDCWCVAAPKPCPYHEGMDDGIDGIRAGADQ